MTNNHVDVQFDYGFFQKNRGLAICLLVLVLVLLWSVFFDFPIDEATEVDTLIVGVFGMFFVFGNLVWDYKIRSNHKPVKLQGDFVLFGRDPGALVVPISEISRVESFPTPDDIYDSDYVENMMSSGLRVYTASGEKVLVFSKISGFQSIRRVLSKAGSG